MSSKYVKLKNKRDRNQILANKSYQAYKQNLNEDSDDMSEEEPENDFRRTFQDQTPRFMKQTF